MVLNNRSALFKAAALFIVCSAFQATAEHGNEWKQLGAAAFTGRLQPRMVMEGMPYGCNGVCATAFSTSQLMRPQDCAAFVEAINSRLHQLGFGSFALLSCEQGQAIACADGLDAHAVIPLWDEDLARSIAEASRLQNCQAPDAFTADTLVVSGQGRSIPARCFVL